MVILYIALPILFLFYVIFVGYRHSVMHRLILALGPMSLDSIPDRAARRYRQRILFTSDTPSALTVARGDGTRTSASEWSAQDILLIVERIGNGFADVLSVRPTDRVAILKSNHFDIHLIHMAIVRAGGIACPMNPDFVAEKAGPYLSNVRAGVLVTDRTTLMRLVRERAELGLVRSVVCVDADRRTTADLLGQLSATNVPAAYDVEQLVAARARPDWRSRRRPDICYLVHSSGTTGFPKSVILRNRAQSWAVRAWLCYVHASHRYDRGLFAVPNNHQAVILSVHSALIMGLRVHWTQGYKRGDFDPDHLLASVSRGGFTGLFAFPIVYTQLKERDLAGFDLSRVRFWASTADACHEAIIRPFTRVGGAFRRLGLPVSGGIYLDAQGSSEVGTPSVVRYYTRFTRRYARRVGFRYSTPFGPRLRIAVDGRRVKRGQVGRLEVKGRTVTPGYWNNDELTTAAMHDGWFFTGDVARLTLDGYVVQLDREVDVIHTSAGPRYTLEIEEVVHKHPAVFDACVFGARQDDGHQVPAAVIALSRPTNEELLLDELNAELAPDCQLAAVHVIDWVDFPVGLTGKTLKRMLRDQTEAIAPAEANRPILLAN